MTVPVVAEGFMSDLMDYVMTLDLGYVSGENYITGMWPSDVRDLGGFLLGTVVLTQFEDSGSLEQSGRRTHQTRAVRFVTKENNPQLSVERCWKLLQAIWNRREFLSTNFHAICTRVIKTPSVMLLGDDQSALADCLLLFSVFNR